MTTTQTIWITTLLLVGVRVIGMFLTAPVLGHRAVPLKLRVLIALVIALAVVGRMPRAVPTPGNTGELLIAAGAELLIGAVIGYIAKLIFEGIQLGAFHIAQQMGLTLSEIFNPLTSEGAGLVRSLVGIVSIGIFLLIGGHRALISGLLTSFETLPAGGAMANPGALLSTIVSVLTSSFALALKVAAPVLITMLLATVAMGMLQKTLPQCNLLSTHLPVRVLVGMTVLAVSIAALHPLLRASVEYLVLQISTLKGLNV